MSVKKYGLNGVSTLLEMGKNGLKIKSNGTLFQAYNNAEDTLVALQAADGSNASDVVTKGQLDTKQDTLSVAAGSSNYLDITGSEISVKNLLVHDVEIDTTSADLAAFVASSYTVGNEFQEGDIIVLTAATDSQKRTYIHNGGTAVTTADFTRLQVDLSETVIRAMFSAGTGIAYNSSTGVISVDATAAEISADDTGFTIISGATAQALLASIDTFLGNVSTNNGYIDTLFGVPTTDQDLGVFSGSTITDDSSVKTALQELETAVEAFNAGCRKIAFSYTDTTVNIGAVIPSGSYVRNVSVKVDTTFDDGASTLAVGVSGTTDKYMGTADNNLNAAGLYEKSNLDVLGANTQVIATVSAGTSTQGSGYIVVEFC